MSESKRIVIEQIDQHNEEILRRQRRLPPVPHYARGAVQPIEFMEGSFTPEEYQGFLKGNVIKYVSRYRYKGTPEADLIKAQTYLG